MEGGTLLSAWRSFKETLPVEISNAPILKAAFAAGASWATEHLTAQRERVRQDAITMLAERSKP